MCDNVLINRSLNVTNLQPLFNNHQLGFKSLMMLGFMPQSRKRIHITSTVAKNDGNNYRPNHYYYTDNDIQEINKNNFNYTKNYKRLNFKITSKYDIYCKVLCLNQLAFNIDKNLKDKSALAMNIIHSTIENNWDLLKIDDLMSEIPQFMLKFFKSQMDELIKQNKVTTWKQMLFYDMEWCRHRSFHSLAHEVSKHPIPSELFDDVLDIYNQCKDGLEFECRMYDFVNDKNQMKKILKDKEQEKLQAKRNLENVSNWQCFVCKKWNKSDQTMCANKECQYGMNPLFWAKNNQSESFCIDKRFAIRLLFDGHVCMCV